MKTKIFRNALVIVFAFTFPLIINANNSHASLLNEYVVFTRLNVLESDEELSIEDWMIDDRTWILDQTEISIDDNKVKEKDLIIEDWMISDRCFKFDSFGNRRLINPPYTDESNEEKLSVEKWMTQNDVWRY